MHADIIQENSLTHRK